MAMNTYMTYLMKKSGSSYTKLVDIKDYPDLGGNRPTLDATTLSDPAHKYIPDIKDNGDALNFTCNYDKEKMLEIQALAETEEDYAVYFGEDGADGKVLFKGYADAHIVGKGVSAVREMVVTIALASDITHE